MNSFRGLCGSHGDAYGKQTVSVHERTVSSHKCPKEHYYDQRQRHSTNLSIDCIVHASSSFPSHFDKSHNSAFQSLPAPRKKKDKKDAKGDNEYFVEQIVRHIRKIPDLKTFVTRYGYSKEHKNLESPNHILRHFDNQYWETKIGKEVKIHTRKKIQFISRHMRREILRNL